MLAWRGEASAENPDLYSALVLTNFSWHWHGEGVPEGGEWFVVLPFHPTVPLPAAESERICAVIEQYSSLPER